MRKKQPASRGPRLDSFSRPTRRDLRQSASLNPAESKEQTQTASQPPAKRPKTRREARLALAQKMKQEFDSSLSEVSNEPQNKKKGFRRLRPSSPRTRRRVKRVLQLSFLSLFLVGAFLSLKLFIAAQSIVVDRSGSALGLQGEIDPSQLKGEGDGRVNILLIGIGGEGHQGSDLNDVNIVVSIDPVNNSASMLSIPRDLYVDIPGFYTSRINSANALGEQRQEGSGPSVAKETVQQVLGIDIHYFVRVDFQGFVEIIDRIGGVTVHVEQPIIDYTIEGAYGEGYGRTFRVDAGEQHLSGPVALQYVRSRKGINSGNDFGRSVRQQQVLRAVKDKVLSLGTFANPVKLAGVIDSVGSHVRTDLSHGDMLRLLEIAEKIDSNSVRSAVLDNSPEGLLASYNANGASVLVPKAGIGNFEAIQRFVRGDIFADGFLAKEGAEISVLNGTTQVGLATEVSEKLAGLGYKVGQTDNAPTSDIVQTVIYDRTGGTAPFTKRLLELRFNVTVVSNMPATISSDSDFVIVLGENYADE